MIPLSADSQRRVGAARFGAALRRAMRAAKVGQGRLAPAAGVSGSSISNYRCGRNLPSVETARLLADVLDAPHLVRLCVEARTVACDLPSCETTFVIEVGSPQRYCSDQCRLVAQTKRDTPVRLRAVGAERRLRMYADVVALMCHECEPEGLCRTAECPLRPVSPLQVVPLRDKEPQPVRPSERNGEAWLRGSLAANARRWTPEARLAWSVHMKEKAASRTPEQRAAFGAAVSAGRRRRAKA